MLVPTLVNSLNMLSTHNSLALLHTPAGETSCESGRLSRIGRILWWKGHHQVVGMRACRHSQRSTRSSINPDPGPCVYIESISQKSESDTVGH